MSLVSLAKIRGNAIEEAILESLNLIGYSLPKEAKKVAIKPNLCYYLDYTTGQTTDPHFMIALISLLRTKVSPTLDISIVESDASAMKCGHVFKILGYEKLSQAHNVRLVNLSEDKSDLHTIMIRGRPYEMMIPRTIADADVRINVPKIKYMIERIKITCALKNVFGCNPYPKKFRYHPQLEEMIVASNKAMEFDLCIVDGNIVSGIHPCKLGLIMASTDPVAVDTVASNIAGVDPSKIRYLKLAEKEGLGRMACIVRGESPDYFRSRYPKRELQGKIMAKGYGLALRMGLSKRLGLD